MAAHPPDLPVSLEHRPGSPMAAVLATALQVGARGHLLVQGEAGTGVEALARFVHQVTAPSAPLRVLGCAGRDEGAVAADLLGAAGESPGRGGLLGEVAEGVLVLDEVGGLRPEVQRGLARALACPPVTAAGGVGEGVHIVGTSARSLAPMVATGQFRRDLYDLLGPPLTLPPLRERREDVGALVERAWPSLARGRSLSRGARERMAQHDWPGNVYEVLALLRRLAMRPLGPVISARDVERELLSMLTGAGWAAEGASAEPGDPPAASGRDVVRDALIDAGQAFAGQEQIDLPALMDSVEARLIEWALRRSGGSRVAAARALCLRRTTLVEKLRRCHRLPLPARPAAKGSRGA